MIKIRTGDKYSHCYSCGKVSEKSSDKSYVPCVAEIFIINLSSDEDPKVNYPFGLCKDCLKKLNYNIKKVIGG